MPVVSQITDHRSQIMIIQDHAPLCGLRVVHSNSRRAAMPLAQVDERNWSPVPAVTRVASPSSLSSRILQVSAWIERRIFERKMVLCTNSSQHLAPAPFIYLGSTRANAR